MALTFTDLVEVDLGRLATAVTDWKNTVDGLKTQAENARKGMQAKSDAARWAGVNATVTREFVGKTTKEIADLHTEANSIYQVLDDAHTELAALQKQIRTAVQTDAPALGIRVEDIGDGKVRCFFPHIRGDTDERTQEQLDARQELEGRVNGLLAHASEIDASVARALRKSHGGDPHNAGHSAYESLNDAQVERALELAHKGDKMTDQELAELNRLIRYNGREKDGEFATEFYEGLGGPEKTLEFYAEMSIDGTGGEATKVRLDAVRDLQQNMGFALANATDPDTAHHLPGSWGADFRRLGTQEIGWEKGQWNKPYGYQVLGGLLRYGNYDARFINPIAEHITQLHKEDPYRFLNNKPMGSEDIYGFNPSGSARHRQRPAQQCPGGARPQPGGLGEVLHRSAHRVQRGRHGQDGRQGRVRHVSRSVHRQGLRVDRRHQRHQHPGRRGQDEEGAGLRPRGPRPRPRIGDDGPPVRQRRHRGRDPAHAGAGPTRQRHREQARRGPRTDPAQRERGHRRGERPAVRHAGKPRGHHRRVHGGLPVVPCRRRGAVHVLRGISPAEPGVRTPVPGGSRPGPGCLCLHHQCSTGVHSECCERRDQR
ncbi:hypothetical protein ACFQ51_26730 [Streptomyces kaempferi]